MWPWYAVRILEEYKKDRYNAHFIDAKLDFDELK